MWCEYLHVSESLVPLLRGESIPQRALFWHYPHYGNQGGEPSSIIMEEKWKLIHYHEDGRDELYNLKSDPGEQQDLAAVHVSRAAAMRKRLAQWLQGTGAKFPEKDPQFESGKRQARWRSLATRGMSNLEQRHARFLQMNFIPNKTWWGSLPKD